MDESAEDFSAKIGRWGLETLAAIQDDFFWGSLFLAHISRGPLNHLHNWLQQRQADGEQPKLLTFVHSKATEIGEEFGILVEPQAFENLWSGFLEIVSAQDVPLWLGRAVQATESASWA